MEKPMHKQRVLMTYMESGYGHITSIKSISDNFKRLYGDQFEVIDSYIMQEDNDPALKKWNNFIIKQTKNTNKIKGYGNFIFGFLKFMGGPRFMRLVHRTVFRKYVNHTLEAFKKRNPDIIVSTHYYMTFAALEYKKKINKNVKVVTYNPDNNIHEWWDNREHLFIVNNEKALYDAIGKKKFNPALVKQVYFNARDEILNANLSKEEYREKLNIPQNKFCVIVADGAYACAKSRKVTNELLKTDKDITIMMLAGKNEKLLKYYEALVTNGKIKSNITLMPLGFKTNIYEYYCAADLFITKAGPNAILDSVFMHTPIIVDYYAHPIEKATTKLFVNEYGVGKAIYNVKKIRKQVEAWIDNPLDLLVYKENTKKIDKFNNGGEETAKLIYAESQRKEVFVSKSDYTNFLYELASKEMYDTYTTPINVNNQKPIYKYDDIKKKGVFSSAYRWMVKGVLKLVGPIVDYFGFHIKILGRKNLKGIKSGVTISNHVHYLDCLWNIQALSHKKNVYITGAPHNFKKGFFGATLKAGGFIPLASSFSQNKEFDEYVRNILNKGGFVHFYPEQALWLRYEQSRPLKKGAFYYASKNNVPVIPMIILFRKTMFRKKKAVTIKICEPIYPENNLPANENCVIMMQKAQEIYDNTIIDFYKYDKNEYAMNKVLKKSELKDKNEAKVIETSFKEVPVESNESDGKQEKEDVASDLVKQKQNQ